MTNKKKTKSHPKVTYLDMNNFYGWAINAVYGFYLESASLYKDFLFMSN